MQLEFDSTIYEYIPVFVIVEIADADPDSGFRHRYVDDIAIYYDGKSLDVDLINDFYVEQLKEQALENY